MSVSPISGVPGILPAAGAGSSLQTAEAGTDGSSFARLVGDMVLDTNAQHAQADSSLTDLMTGNTDNIHDVVLDAARADLSFRLMVEIRNKLLDAYQEIMRMQV